MQGWSLERKIRVTQTRIMEWYMRYDGQVFISFSGGKDSTVLLDLARRVYPDIPAVYVDTGLEYPELRDFVKTKDNVIWLRPRYPFTQILEKYGYPIISKEVSDVINGARKGQPYEIPVFHKALSECGSLEVRPVAICVPQEIQEYCTELFGEDVQIAAASHDLFAKQVNGQIYRPLVEKYIAGEKRL